MANLSPEFLFFRKADYGMLTHANCLLIFIIHHGSRSGIVHYINHSHKSAEAQISNYFKC